MAVGAGGWDPDVPPPGWDPAAWRANANQMNASAAAQQDPNSAQNQAQAAQQQRTAQENAALGGQQAADIIRHKAAAPHKNPANSYMGAYGPGDKPETLDQQVYRDAQALGDWNSNQFKAYGWAGPSMDSRADLAQGAANRAAIQADYSGANWHEQMGAGARQEQANALGLYRDAAAGRGPSAAASQFQQNLDASNRQQMSMAASARGGGLARAAAQRQAMANAGDMTLQAGAQSAQLRAQEQQAAMQGYAGLGSQMRGQDYQAMGQQAQMAQAQAGLGLQSRALNDSHEQFYRGQEMQVGAATTQQNTLREQDRQRGNQGAAALNFGIHDKDKQAGLQATGLVANLATGGITGAMQARSDERAKTDIRDAGEDVDAFLDGLRPSKYRYKAPARDGDGEHVSVMAQELEKSAIGKRLVSEDKHGKLVDYGKGLPAVVASLARINQRLRDVEAKKDEKPVQGLRPRRGA